MLSRSFNTDLINWLVNHPDIRPHVGMPEAGELDMHEAVMRPENIFLLGEHGGFSLIWSAPETYEIHTFITKDGRGLWAFRAVKAMLLFAKEHGAKRVWTKVAVGARNVEIYTLKAGLKPTGEIIETFGLPYAVYLKDF